MVGLLDGRIYYRLDAWFTLHDLVPGFALVRPTWERSMGLAGTGRPSGSELRHAVIAVPGLALRLARLPGQLRRFLRWWDDLVTSHADLDSWSAEQLVVGYQRLWAEAGRRWESRWSAASSCSVRPPRPRLWCAGGSLGTPGTRSGSSPGY